MKRLKIRILCNTAAHWVREPVIWRLYREEEWKWRVFWIVPNIKCGLLTRNSAFMPFLSRTFKYCKKQQNLRRTRSHLQLLSFWSSEERTHYQRIGMYQNLLKTLSLHHNIATYMHMRCTCDTHAMHVRCTWVTNMHMSDKICWYFTYLSLMCIACASHVHRMCMYVAMLWCICAFWVFVQRRFSRRGHELACVWNI